MRTGRTKYYDATFVRELFSLSACASARACATRVGLRLLALAAGLRHNAETGQPGRCFSAYGR
jgi:hypothetical protein